MQEYKNIIHEMQLEIDSLKLLVKHTENQLEFFNLYPQAVLNTVKCDKIKDEIFAEALKLKSDYFSKGYNEEQS